MKKNESGEQEEIRDMRCGPEMLHAPPVLIPWASGWEGWKCESQCTRQADCPTDYTTTPYTDYRCCNGSALQFLNT